MNNEDNIMFMTKEDWDPDSLVDGAEYIVLVNSYPQDEYVKCTFSMCYGFTEVIQDVDHDGQGDIILRPICNIKAAAKLPPI